MLSRVLLAACAVVASVPAFGAVTLVDAGDWKVQLSGFVEMDVIHDSTRDLPEVVGSKAVAARGTKSFENGRTQFSMRNTRFAFAVLPPVQEGWKTKGYIEYDLLGYDPNPGAAPANSEASFTTNPTLRMRHAYLSAESNGWSLLAGQYWTLFGFQPTYVLATASVPPVTGTLYQRTPQVTLTKDIVLGETAKLLAGVSVTRPAQRDSERPNYEAGLKFSTSAVTSGFASPNGEVKLEPLSVAVSGTWRQFVNPEDASVTSRQQKHEGSAVALNAMIPVLPAGETAAGSLTLTGEYSVGQGHGDAFPSWAGVPPLYSNSTDANPNLDAGQGAYTKADASFRLVQLQAWNTQLQYHLPGDLRTFVTLGYGELRAARLGDLTGASYDRSQAMFANVFHDFTKQIRGAVEYAKFTTHFVDTSSAANDRFMLAGYFRF